MEKFHSENKGKLLIDEEVLIKQFQKALNLNIVFSAHQSLMSNANMNSPKVLHWFDWCTNKLNLFDVIEGRKEVMSLLLHSKVPNYSRSVMSNEGKIFLNTQSWAVLHV